MLFHCQQCNAPIALDSSLESLTKGQMDILLRKSEKMNEIPKPKPTSYIPEDRLNLAIKALSLGNNDPHISLDFTDSEDSTSESKQTYVYVSDGETETDIARKDLNAGHISDPQEESELYGDGQLPEFSKVKSLSRVFSVLSSNQDVNFPMCLDCAQLLSENYKLKFDQSQREKEYYMTFLKKMKEREFSMDMTGDAMNTVMNDSINELRQLEQLQDSKLKELETLESTYSDLNTQLNSLSQELDNLNVGKLEEVAKLRNSLNLELSVKQNKFDKAKALYQKQLDYLDELRSLNIYTKLFSILFEDKWGRINGFRIGYKVPWPEINVALGQIVQLITFLQKQLSVNLHSYELIPLGSKSYILKDVVGSNDSTGNLPSKNHSVLPLFSSNEFTLGKLFNFNKLDVSMMALLDIVSQLELRLMNLDNELELPYKISAKHDSIGGKSIRVTSNGQWTEACRYLLIDLNWILAYVSAQ